MTTIDQAQAAETNVFTHERSPTGITPSTKRQKRPQKQELISTARSKKSLFGNGETKENTVEYENVDDAIKSLMNLPIELSDEVLNIPPVVKVKLFIQNRRVLDQNKHVLIF